MKKFRKHIRLKGYDYSAPNYYFVTICTDFRRKLFEPRVSERYKHELPRDLVEVVAPSYGAELSDAFVENLGKLEEYYQNIEIDFFCLMPDHAHMIVVILDKAAYDAATTGKRTEEKHTDLPGFITALKSCTTRGAKVLGFEGKSLWQPNYYEHIVRSEEALDGIRNYILQNPWVEYDEINWKLLDPSL